MRVVSTDSFNRDIARIREKELALKVESAIRKIELAEALNKISGLKKLSGSKNAFRIRVGDYRIGFYIINETIQLTILAHRKEIYKRFP